MFTKKERYYAKIENGVNDDDQDDDQDMGEETRKE